MTTSASSLQISALGEALVMSALFSPYKEKSGRGDPRPFKATTPRARYQDMIESIDNILARRSRDTSHTVQIWITTADTEIGLVLYEKRLLCADAILMHNGDDIGIDAYMLDIAQSHITLPTIPQALCQTINGKIASGERITLSSLVDITLPGSIALPDLVITSLDDTTCDPPAIKLDDPLYGWDQACARIQTAILKHSC